MRDISVNPDLVAFCGLYCGACKSYLNEKCQGCHENTKASWCTVRTCCREKNISSCAECAEYSDVKACKKFNNAFSRIFGVLFNSDRAACIQQIKTVGLQDHADLMTKRKAHTIKR